MALTYDVIVVGAGAVGSAAAYYAAKSGQSVALLEQFEIDHQFGSSYGRSRITRYAYDHPVYIELAKAAYPAWAALEDDAGETLYVKTGGLDFGFPDDHSLRETIRSLDASQIPYSVLSPADASRMFPQWRFDDGMQVVYQADSGLLPASKCVLAHVRLAKRYGADVYENSPVLSITATDSGVEVRTPTDIFSAGSIILVPGAWGKEVFEMVGIDLPLMPLKAQESYFAAEPADLYDAARFPVFIAHVRNEQGLMFYGIASHEGSGVKVGVHGGPVVPNVRAMNRDPEPMVEQNARRFMRRYLPGAADAPMVFARSCLYTMTPDEHFVVDQHPEHRNVIISASCSGHAFKFSTLLGKILNDLARHGDTPHDISLFRMARFAGAGVTPTANVFLGQDGWNAE